MLQVGDTEKFPEAFGLECLDPLLRVSKQGPCVTAIAKDGGDKRLVQLELVAKLIVLHRQILFSLAITAIAEAILMRISAEQVPSLHRFALR